MRYEQLAESKGWLSRGSHGCMVYDLSQNPKERPVVSSRNGSLPTIRRGSLLWCKQAKRWMTAEEVACAMGLPVTEALCQAARISSDVCARGYARSQLGNGMHIPCVGLASMVALACIQEKIMHMRSLMLL